jgi:hypothetical protein
LLQALFSAKAVKPLIADHSYRFTIACEIGLNVTAFEQDSGNPGVVRNRSRRSPLSADEQIEDG